jgi:hypothetical protein
MPPKLPAVEIRNTQKTFWLKGGRYAYGHTGAYERMTQEYKVDGICVAEGREY